MCILHWQHKKLNNIYGRNNNGLLDFYNIYLPRRNVTHTCVTGQSKYFPPENNDFSKD